MVNSREHGLGFCDPSNLRRSGLVIYIALSAVIAANGQNPQSDWEQRFLSEAPACWQDYRVFAQGLQGSQTIRAESNGKAGLENRLEFKVNKVCRLLQDQALNNLNKNRGEKTVFAVNPDYSFTLQRRDPQSGWLITSLKMQADGRDARVDSDISAALDNNCILIAPYNNWFLIDLLRQPSFRVIRAAPVDANRGQWVQIDFDNTHPLIAGAKGFFPIQAGTLVLDPNRYWTVRSARLICQHGATKVVATIELEVRDLAGKYPIPKRYVEKRERRDGDDAPQRETWLREFDLAEVSPLPADAEFRLSAFGLPEPPGLESKRPFPWYLWLGYGTAGVILVGTVIGWFKRRLSR
jgi:hypothetical protein